MFADNVAVRFYSMFSIFSQFALCDTQMLLNALQSAAIAKHGKEVL